MSSGDCEINLNVCLAVRLQLEEDEAEDSFDVDVAVTNPEKIGQSAFKVMTLMTFKMTHRILNT